jgi:DNA-binding HxlR family transcriptional regulator
MDEIRLTIVMELYMREMGPRQFFETIGGTSYSSIHRHFVKLVETGWLRKVRTAAPSGVGHPEVLYRSTEQAVIDTETWSTIPVSIRDAFTVMLLEEMAARLGEALEGGTAEARADRVATFKVLEIDELTWRKAQEAIERCFQTLKQEQIDAKIRLENSQEQPLLMIVNLGAFEASGPQVPARLALPKVAKLSPPEGCPYRMGKVFSDRLDLAIIDELNRASMTPAQLRATLGGTSAQGFLRRCTRLKEYGWVARVGTRTGGALRGAQVPEFRAASPSVSEQDIIQSIPGAIRKGQGWDAFEHFVAASVGAVDAGAFNSRFDRHLSMSPLLVDEIGWNQVTEALRRLEATLVGLEALTRHMNKSNMGFRAGFFLSAFQTPLRELRG